MAMVPKMSIIRPNSASTPPNCAICLGGCTDKCFSDSCLHQFCFQCLLEWSKIKAECPLCKQPFKSILHNVTSNENYEEHVVEIPRNDHNNRFHEDLWFLPISRQEFHVRTTFTLDTGSEHAIQEMLLNHPITNGRITVNAELPSGNRPIHLFPTRLRRDSSATFRRSLYAQNLWVTSRPDLTGRYRECSPTFFRNNPAARQRLVPWLNRELNALLHENTQLIMFLFDLILDRMLTHHICSHTFRNMLREYLDNKTDHFVHEFYSFMRSPLDMTGYDRYSIYTNRPHSPAPIYDDDPVEILDDNSNDSDVVLVETTPPEPVTIDLVESDSDDPILVSSWPSSTVVEPASPSPTLPSVSSSPVNVSNLPPKLRYKQMWVDRKNKRRYVSSTEYSTSEISESEKESYRKYYKRRKMKKKLRSDKLKNKKSFSFDNNTPSSTEVNISSQSDSDDDKPLMRFIKKIKQKNKKNKKNKRRSSRHEEFSEQSKPDVSHTQIFPMDLSTPSSSSSDVKFPTPPSSSVSNSRYHIELPKTRSTVELSDNGQYTSVQIETSSSHHTEPSSSTTKIKIVRNGLNSPPPQPLGCSVDEDSFSSGSTEPYIVPAVKSEVREVNPGPSTSKSAPLVLRRDRNNWFVFGNSDDSSD